MNYIDNITLSIYIKLLMGSSVNFNGMSYENRHQLERFASTLDSNFRCDTSHMPIEEEESYNDSYQPVIVYNKDLFEVHISCQDNNSLRAFLREYSQLYYEGALIENDNIHKSFETLNNELIEATNRKIEALKEHKKGLYTELMMDGKMEEHLGQIEQTSQKRMKEIIGNDMGNRIKWYGRLNNDEAIAFMDKIDILALPTYMGAEAFPISILEAMSLGKLVISTKRAAIPDILTALDGSPCGILVKERSVEDIANAIDWCITNNSIADSICIKAYEKVYHCYRTDIVYNSYLENYKELLRK